MRQKYLINKGEFSNGVNYAKILLINTNVKYISFIIMFLYIVGFSFPQIFYSICAYTVTINAQKHRPHALVPSILNYQHVVLVITVVLYTLNKKEKKHIYIVNNNTTASETRA